MPEAVSYYSCPNKTSVKFTCHDVGILAMLWISASYFPDGDSIIYLAGQSSFPVHNRGPFITVLTKMTINEDEILQILPLSLQSLLAKWRVVQLLHV